MIENTLDKKLNLSSKEAAQLIGCSTYTILELARQKKVPHHKVGRYVKFTLHSLMEWINKQEQESCQTK